MFEQMPGSETAPSLPLSQKKTWELKMEPDWWERDNPQEVLKTSLIAFIERDLEIIRSLPEFSCIFKSSDQALRKSAREIAHELGVEDRQQIAGIVLALKNAQFSVLIDETIVTFFKEEPMSPPLFEERLGHIVLDPKKKERFLDVYRTLCARFPQDQKVRLKEEVLPEDILEKFGSENVVRPDWVEPRKTDLEWASDVLRWTRGATERGELVRVKGPKRDLGIDRDVLLLRLPFLDVVAVEGGNNQMEFFELTEDAKRQGKELPDGRESYQKNALHHVLGAIAKCEGQAYPEGVEGRGLIVWRQAYTYPFRGREKREERFYKDLSHLRHEVRHIFDGLLKVMNGPGVHPLSFYYPKGTYSKNERTTRTVQEAIPVETQHLLSEIKAMCLNARPLGLGSYLEQSLTRLKKNTVDGDQQELLVEDFKQSWERIIGLLDELQEYFDEESPLDSKEMPAEPSLRWMTLVIYHCIATAETAQEVFSRLRVAVKFIVVDDRKQSQKEDAE